VLNHATNHIQQRCAQCREKQKLRIEQSEKQKN
jgi:hypothetical protein